MKSKHREFVDL
jgi:hypothetical protein